VLVAWGVTAWALEGQAAWGLVAWGGMAWWLEGQAAWGLLAWCLEGQVASELEHKVRMWPCTAL